MSTLGVVPLSLLNVSPSESVSDSDEAEMSLCLSLLFFSLANFFAKADVGLMGSGPAILSTTLSAKLCFSSSLGAARAA